MTHNEKRAEWWREGLISLGTGILYGTSNTLVGHPADTVKSKMQADAAFSKLGMRAAARKMWVREGVRAFYRGVIPPLWGSALYRSAQFAVFEAAYTRFSGVGSLERTLPLTGGIQAKTVLAAMTAATARAVLEAPIEAAKVMRQLGQPWVFSQLYRGFSVQWIRTGGLMTSYFLMIDSVRRHSALMTTPVGQFFASGCAATAAFFLVWPFEFQKNLHQSGTALPGDKAPPSLPRLVRHVGVTGLYRGLAPGAISIFTRNGAAMIVMQYANKKVSEWGLRG